MHQSLGCELGLQAGRLGPTMCRVPQCLQVTPQLPGAVCDVAYVIVHRAGGFSTFYVTILLLRCEHSHIMPDSTHTILQNMQIDLRQQTGSDASRTLQI